MGCGKGLPGAVGGLACSGLVGVYGAVFFPLAGVALFAFVVGEKATTCACASADQRAFTAAEETAYDGAARSGASDDFRFGVMAGIGVVLLPAGPVVRLSLAMCGKGKQTEARRKNESGACKDVHGVAFLHQNLGSCGCRKEPGSSSPMRVCLRPDAPATTNLQ